MPHLRDILNEIKWTKDIQMVMVWYVHRGAVHNLKTISGCDITNIGRSFLQTTTASIPYHRIIKVLYGDEVIFDRNNLRPKDKQL